MRVFVDSNEDHYQMLMMIKSWPEWQKSNWTACCYVIVALEDEKSDNEKVELYGGAPGKPEH